MKKDEPGSSSGVFPDNVWFLRENYVLEADEDIDMVREEYDVILALSITKWVHLNWGDAGVKRFFRRAFRQLLPGGRLILEIQAYSTYWKKSKLVGGSIQLPFYRCVIDVSCLGRAQAELPEYSIQAGRLRGVSTVAGGGVRESGGVGCSEGCVEG